jgi:energy-coupling factor transport system substrate-specific component
MKALFTMWRDTRLVVMTSVLAALHAAAVIPFKPIQILPGVTDLRPGMALPLVFSLLFGPPAAWGAAFGNLLSDLFGTLGPGSLFGFLGNLLYGYLPWRIWRAWRGSAVPSARAIDLAVLLLAVAGAAGACALVIGWGVHMLGLYPFVSTSGIILVHNLIVGLVLAPPLFLALRPRVARLNLLYEESPDGSVTALRVTRRALSLVLVSVVAAGFLSGYAAQSAGSSDAALTAAVSPFVAALLLVVILV